MEQLTLAPPLDDAAAPLPPPAPLEMPAQRLSSYDHTRPRLTERASVNFARAGLALAAALLSILLIHQMWLVLSVGELTGVERVMLGLFVINITWISFGALSPLMGYFLGTASQPTPSGPSKRTALLMPTYNEDPARILGAACAMLRALEAKGAGEAFDLFLLSDTTDADVWLAEQAMVDAARADPVIGPRIFYRHRPRNLRRKAGNIADWVERWGGAYPFMLVLDADSLMEPDCIIELARRMDADDTLGILQSSPYLIGGETPLARVQQFASRVYGPVLTRGLRAWFGNAGNYWGHNAIMRTAAFAGFAGLPELPGKPPFGGLILSHDFVEAAFIRRGGWAVRMADDLPGSYEHAPPNLVELASRDRRWCQGNLQHVRLLGTAGLHPLSRLHLFMGVMSYLASPLWLLFLLSGMSLALHAYLVPPDYFLDRFSLFPDWPRIDPERAMALFGLCMLVLYAPKLLGTAAFLRHRDSRGLRGATVLGFVAELLLSALVAPIMMLVQTSAVVQILTGRDSGWNATGARQRPGALAALVALPPPAHDRRRPARGRGGRDLLAAPRLDEPGADRPRARRPARRLHGQRRRRAGAGAPRHPPDPGGARPPCPRRGRRCRGRGAARPRPRARRAARPPRRPAGAGAAPGLARPADVPPTGRAGCRPGQRAPEALRRPAARPAGRPRDLRRPRLARDALGARARAGRSPAQMNDL